MTFTQQSIERAIAGGWNPSWFLSHFNEDEVAFGDNKMDSENNPCHYVDLHKILLDPAFFQALGKAEGWCTEAVHFDSEECKPPKYYQHRLIDALAEGKSVESFFEEVLKK